MFQTTRNGSLLNKAVLVLNTNYSPLMICTARRAICLKYLEKVDILVTYKDKVHSPSITVVLPSIIKLKDFVHYNSMNVVMSRKNIMIRDKHTCQYCGAKSSSMTIDHIIPKERGGSDYWDNLVAACQQCNKKKDNLTPDEAKMPLQRLPRKPNRIHYFQQFINRDQTAWRPYLFLESF